MSYRISYGKEQHKKDKGYLISGIIAVLLAVLAITNGLYLYRGSFYDFHQQLMPWTQPRVLEAFAVFSEELAQGEGLTDCVEDFVEALLVE